MITDVWKDYWQSNIFIIIIYYYYLFYALGLHKQTDVWCLTRPQIINNINFP